jgi:hypothetical protein
MQRFTGLQRIFNPLQYKTHQAIVVIGIASGALALAVGNEIVDAFWSGIAAGLGWVIARELHPDNEFAGLAAGVVAGVFQALVGGVGLGVCYLLIVFLRIIIRTTGAAPTTFDLVLNLIIVFFVSDTLPGFLASLGVGLALFLSPILPRPSPKQHRIWAFAFAAAALTGLASSSRLEAPDPSAATWMLLALAALASIGLVPATSTESVGDFDNEPLDEGRVRLGRIELIALLAVVTISTLGSGVAATAPALAAILATGAFRIRELVAS